MNQQNLEKIKKITEEFFKKITLEIEIEFLPLDNQTIPINLKTDEPQILIGERGQTLIEIQHLLKTILRKKLNDIGEVFFIDIDIAGYKKKKIEYLKELSRSIADEVYSTKKEKSLDSMPAYERRIIHLELADRQDIVTESIGQGMERKVLIKPKQ